MEGKEERIRKITNFYYSKPEIQNAILEFAKNREVVPKYFEGFGKRPDTLQYTSDITGLVKKGATSFHASEELWEDPLEINSDWTKEEMNKSRKNWDLVIDIDSPFLDFSKIAAKLLIEELENQGMENYGIKFSGSKGFHIIVSNKAFPAEYDNKKTNEMFPEWPRAICEYLMDRIKPRFVHETHKISNIKALEIRTNKKKEELVEVVCPQCNGPVKHDKWVTIKCDYCKNENRQKKSGLAKKRVIRCHMCEGILKKENFIDEEDFFECINCKISNISKLDGGKGRIIKYSKEARAGNNVVIMNEGLHEAQTGGFDLVLVAPRHLFRMPYSLHEKTSLASVVLKKEEIDSFEPKDADPMKIKVIPFYPINQSGEGLRLLSAALKWKKSLESEIEENQKKSYKDYEEVDLKGITENMFPKPILKLLKGLNDGKKRGLFVLLTFLKSLGFSAEYINQRIREWNKSNEPPLKEGYIKGQIDWHLKQKKKILPPNYNNENFYRDLGILDEKPKAKNPLVEVMRKLRKKE